MPKSKYMDNELMEGRCQLCGMPGLHFCVEQNRLTKALSKKKKLWETTFAAKILSRSSSESALEADAAVKEWETRFGDQR